MFTQTSQKLFLLACLLLLILPIMAQENLPIPESTAEFTASFTDDLTITPSPTNTATITATSTLAPETTELSESNASPEATEDNNTTPEMTAEATDSPETQVATPEATAESTETLTATNTSIATPITITPVPDRVLRGRVRYQTGENHSGISIRAWSEQGWASQTISDEQGFYNLELISSLSFQIEFSAPSYLSHIIMLVPGDSPSVITLMAGDLNADDCVESQDLELLLTQFDRADTPDTDLNFDGMTDVFDLVILTANMSLACDALQTSNATPDNTTLNPAVSPPAEQTASMVTGTPAMP